MEPWAHGVEAQYGALDGLQTVVAESHLFDEEQDPDPNYPKAKNLIQIHFQVKYRIWICNKSDGGSVTLV